MKTDGAIKQIEIYRRMNGPERLRIGCELYDLVREIITASVRQMFPALSEQEIQKKIKERMTYDTK